MTAPRRSSKSVKAGTPRTAVKAGTPRTAGPGSHAVREEWRRRVEAEYTSAAVTQELVLWLIRIGASPDLILDGLRIVRDELAHARMSHATYRAAGGRDAPALSRAALGYPRDPDEPLELAAVRCCVDVYCLGETVAVPLFAALRDACSVPVARRALDRILRDEVRHRDFGWTLLDHLLERDGTGALRALVVAALPRFFERIRREYAADDASAPAAVPAPDRAWGLMARDDYRKITLRALSRDWAPRFAARGIDARAAWG